MKQLVVIALVMLVVFTGIPLAMSMPVGERIDCGPALVGGLCLLAVIALGVALSAGQLQSLLRVARSTFRIRLVVGGVERPPRLA